MTRVADLTKSLYNRHEGTELPPETLETLTATLADPDADEGARADALEALTLASRPALQAALYTHWRASRARGRGVADEDRDEAHAAVLTAVWEAATRWRPGEGSWWGTVRATALGALADIRGAWPAPHIPEYAARLYRRALADAGGDLMVAMQRAAAAGSAMTPARLLQVHHALAGHEDVWLDSLTGEYETAREVERDVAVDAVMALQASLGDENDWTLREREVAWLRCGRATPPSWSALAEGLGVSRRTALYEWASVLEKSRRRLGLTE